MHSMNINNANAGMAAYKGVENMKQRIVTAILALILFLPIVFYGSWPFVLLIYLLATIGLIELVKMNDRRGMVLPIILSVLLLWVILAADKLLSVTWLGINEGIMVLVFSLLVYTVLAKNKFTFTDAAFLLLATLYVGFGFYYMMETRMVGLNYFFYVLLVIWATDTGAYFFGRFFGKKKLWPAISPKKTMEGSFGGIAAACVVAVVYHHFVPLPHSYLVLLGGAIITSVFGQIGDLVESAFKRHYGVKDSGKLLPGHGGVLDRFDSLIFVFPLLHLIGFFQ